MLKITARMNWLEEQIKIQEDALVTCSPQNAPAHSYLLQKLTDEWCARSAKGEISSATAALGGYYGNSILS